MMPMPHRRRQVDGEAIGADIIDRPFFEQAMIGARSDSNALSGAPIHGLRQAQRVVAGRCAVAERHPGCTRFTMQIYRSAIKRRQKLAAQLRVRSYTRLRHARTQRDMQSLLERLLSATGNQRTSAFDQDPFGADRDVAPFDDRSAFDVQ